MRVQINQINMNPVFHISEDGSELQPSTLNKSWKKLASESLQENLAIHSLIEARAKVAKESCVCEQNGRAKW